MRNKLVLLSYLFFDRDVAIGNEMVQIGQGLVLEQEDFGAET